MRRAPNTAVYTAQRESDHLEVVLKVHTSFSEAGADAHFEHEFHLLRQLRVDGAVRALDFLRLGDLRILVLERFDGVDLAAFAARRPLALEQLLAIAVGITRTLAAVHARRVIHRDLKPSNILVAPADLETCLADFGISVALEHSLRQIYDPEVLRGTLPYISPEQTGRTTRGIDQRSDLYSLGVVFYELLAGRRPFEAEDPLALMHAHLARRPRPLDELRDLPPALAAMVHRLLAKDPADRYQSARGLLHDLERCRAGLGAGRPVSFQLGTADVPATPQLPSRLYGRSAERAALASALERARDGVELVLVRGQSGIGKTALVAELHGPLAGLGGLFAVGKCDQHRRDVPLLAPRRALASLADQLLVEDDRRLSERRRRLRQAVGGLAGVLVELVPRLEGLLGEQPSPAEVGPIESRHRLLLAVKRLLCAVATPRQPLVLFLDDLQWGDPVSLRLLEELVVEREADHLLVVGAWRNDLAAPTDLAQLPRRLEAGGGSATELELGALPVGAVAELLADSLRCGALRARRLAEILAGRTENNPLLVRQLLLHLLDEGHLRLAAEGWVWDEAAVRTAGIPAGAVAMIRAKVGRLPAQLAEVLGAASCLGSRIDLPRLAAALERRPVALLPALETLCEEGLLAASGGGYRFSHDRIEEAALAGVEPALAARLRGRVGRFLLRETPEDELGERLFEIVEHLNAWLPHADDPGLLLELARLDHRAGHRAIGLAAFASARRYLASGLQALGGAHGSGPEVDALELALDIDHARSLALSDRADDAAEHFDRLLARVDEPLDAARVCAARLEVLAMLGNYEEAARWGLRGLASCGLKLPRQPTRLRLWWLRRRLRQRYRGPIRRRLLDLPPCDEPAALLRTELFSRLIIPSYALGDTLHPVLILRQALHLLRHGRSPHAGFPLALAGAQLVSVLGEVAAAEQVADAALELSRGTGTECRTAMGAHHAVMLWILPYRQCAEALEAAHAIGCEEGDIEFAGLALPACTTLRMVGGSPLAEVRWAAERADSFLTAAGLTGLVNRQQGLDRLYDELEGRATAEVPGETGPFADISAISESLWRLELLVFTDRAQLAWRTAEAVAERAERVFFSTHHLAEFVFFHALAAADCLEPATLRLRGRRQWRRLRRAQRRLERWSRHCPANFEHKALLLAAERARLTGRTERALVLYQRASASAGEHGVLHLQALITERLGRFARARGWSELARAPLRRARELYAAWGARRKVEQLDRELAACAGEPGAADEADEAARTGSSSGTGEPVDLASMLKVTQAISEEIVVDRVISRMMAAAVENAGARRGALLLDAEGRLELVAEHVAGESTRLHGPPLELESCAERLALAPVRLAARTGEAQVVADASADRRWSADPYVAARRPRSLACFPIQASAQRRGLLYVENELAAGVFSAARADVLKVLATQAAISLENARLYEEQQRRVKRLSGLLPICSQCKKIRDDEGYWNQLEVYLDEHSGVSFSHGLCPDCFGEFATELDE